MSTETKCPICHGAAKKDGQWNIAGNPVGHSFRCTRCGSFLMTVDVAQDLQMKRPPWWHRLSAWTRERTDNGERLVQIAKSLDEVEASIPTRSFTWQLDRLLQLLAKEARHIGDVVSPSSENFAPLVWARGPAEVEELMTYLRKLERLDPDHGGDVARMAAKLSAKGLFRLEEISENAALNDRIFVAMWFTDELKPAGKAISDAIRAAGYVPHLLLDQPAHGDRIDAKILVDIRRSRGLIVDVTGPLLKSENPCPRPSVMYEGGFAEGLGKPVIWTVREDQVEHLPFDTRQLLHVGWTTPADLAAKLQPVIEARLGSRVGGAQ